MLLVTLVFVTVILLALCQQSLVPGLPLLATLRNYQGRAVSGTTMLDEYLHAAIRVSDPGGPRTSREARRLGRDPLRNHRAVVGRDARTPWYIRVRALLLLVVIVVGVAMAFAGVTLLLIASGRFVLEILAG